MIGHTLAMTNPMADVVLIKVVCACGRLPYDMANQVCALNVMMHQASVGPHQSRSSVTYEGMPP